jgi:uncharacterized protein
MLALRRVPAFAAAFVLLICASLALAQTFPKLTGRVVDDAHLLSAEQVQEVSNQLAQLEQDSGRQLVVVTVPDLQGYEIEDYGYRLGRAWGIGSKDSNDGALLIIAPKERKVRVEVGYGLEPVLTDALSSVIIQTQILPQFRQGNMAAGIIAGTTAIVSQLRLPEDQAKAYAAEAAKRPRDEQGSIAPLLVWLVIMGFLVVPLFRRRRFGRSGPVVMWGPGFGGGSSGGGFGGFGGGGGGGGFSGGGGSFGGGGASGGW